MRSYAVKRDASHAGIRKAYIDAGVTFMDMAHVAGLGCDFIAVHRDGYPVFVEAKNPGTAPSLLRLTKSEQELRAAFPRNYVIAQTPEQALAAVGIGAAA